MGNPSFFDVVRELIGHIAWSVFLWSHRMTDEQYDYAVHIGCEPVNTPLHCEHGYNGLCYICDAMMTPPSRVTQ